MRQIIIAILFFLPLTVFAQLLRSYGVVEIGSTFPASTSTGAKFAYRTTDSSFYRWIAGNTWVKVVEPSITQDTLYLTEEIGTTVKLNGDTINLTPYLLKSDTMSMLVRYIERGDTLGMLSAYIRSAGWGLLKSSYTLRADSSLLATKLYANRFIVPSGQVAVGTGSGLTGYANFLFDGRVRAPYGYFSTSYGFVGEANKFIEGNPDGLRFNADAGLGFFFNSSGGSVLPNTTNMQLGFFNRWWNNVWIGRVFARAASGSSSGAHYSFQDGSGNTYGGGMYVTGTAANNNLGFSTKATAEASATAKLWINADGKIAIGTNFTSPSYVLDINSTDAIRIPRGTDAQEPTSAAGLFRYNTTGSGYTGNDGSGRYYFAKSDIVGGGGTNTYVPYFNSNGRLDQDAGFRYDAPKDNLGIGGAPSAQLHLQGNKSAASWTTSGIALRIDGGSIYTNTTSSGNINDLHASVLGQPVFAFTNPTTVRDAATFLVGGGPTPGTNATLTNSWAIRAGGKSYFNQIYSAPSVQNIGGTLSDLYGSGAKGFFSTGQTWGSGAAIVAGSNINSNNTTGYGIIAAIRSSSSGNTNANGVGVASELSMNPANTSGSWVNFSASGSIVINGSGVLSTGYSLNVTPVASTVGGYNGGSYTGFGGSIASRSRQGFATVRGFYWGGLGGVTTSDNTTITNYNPLAIATGSLTEVTNAWSYIDHKTTIGSSGISARTLHVAGEVRITDLTTDTPNRIVGADADGDLGTVPVSSSLKIASGILDLKHKSLIDSLPIASVSIDAVGNDFEIAALGNLNFNFEYAGGIIASDGDVMDIIQDSELNLIGEDSRVNIADDIEMSAPNTEGSIGFNFGGEFWNWTYTNDGTISDTAMTLETLGDEAVLRLHDYGLGNITVATVSENPGLNIPVFTPTGKILEMRITRDTFVEDQTLFSVGTLLYTCDHLFINSSMTGTAPANMELRFPDPAEVFRGKKITVYSGRKDASSFVPQIKVAGGSSRLRYTTDPSISGSMPSDQSILSLDGSTWSYNGVSYEWTCIKIDASNYRWVLKQ